MFYFTGNGIAFPQRNSMLTPVCVASVKYLIESSEQELRWNMNLTLETDTKIVRIAKKKLSSKIRLLYIIQQH